MELIGEFFINHWIIVLIINIAAFIFIVGFFLESLNKKEKKQKNKKINDKIIFDQDKSVIENKVILDQDSYKASNTQKNIKANNDKIDDTNLNKFDNKTKKKIKDNIDNIINQSNSVFDDFDKIIPEKKLIDDDIKNELEYFDDDVQVVKKQKKHIKIDTNIDLPKIDLPIDDEDIWS